MFTIVSKIFDSFNYFVGKQIYKYVNYDKQLLQWINQIIYKNKIIHESKVNVGSDGKIHDIERNTRERSYVYWIDFGINIGSEFNSKHFGVVVKEFDYTALVVPISTVKTSDSSWKNRDNLIVPIGKIEGLKGKKEECYAMINQMKSLSKQRLSFFSDKTLKITYNKLRLSNNQMDLIDNAILDIIGSKTFKSDSFRSDYY